jgi:predicted nuclease of predicted toxin-antitoxin system
MKFLVDAHLPKRLALRLRESDHDVVHTLELPGGNRTTATEINRLSVAEQRVVISKDADFVNSYLLRNKPYKLLLVSTGNISNVELEALFVAHFDDVAAAFKTHSFIELTRDSLILHE